MKTTIDIPDELVQEAKIFAARERKSLRTIVIRALKRELSLEGSPARGRTPLPVISLPADIRLPVMTNSEIDELSD